MYECSMLWNKLTCCRLKAAPLTTYANKHLKKFQLSFHWLWSFIRHWKTKCSNLTYYNKCHWMSMMIAINFPFHSPFHDEPYSCRRFSTFHHFHLALSPPTTNISQFPAAVEITFLARWFCHTSSECTQHIIRWATHVASSSQVGTPQ